MEETSIEQMTLINNANMYNFSTGAAITVSVICIIIIAFAAINLHTTGNISGNWKVKAENITWIALAIVVTTMVWNAHSNNKEQYRVIVDDEAQYLDLIENYDIIEQNGNEYIVQVKD